MVNVWVGVQAVLVGRQKQADREGRGPLATRCGRWVGLLGQPVILIPKIFRRQNNRLTERFGL